MYRKIYLTLLFLVALFPRVSFSAPAFSISDPGIWGEGVLSYDAMFSPVFSVLVQDQSYKFPEQINRFVGIKPDDLNQEERHYKRIRSSKLDYTSLEAMAGIKIWDRLFLYGLVGRANVDFTFKYSDNTLTVPGGTLSVTENFEPDESLIFGGGISGIMYDQSFTKEFIDRLKLGFDARFRQISFRTDWVQDNTRFYKTYLNEYQFALITGVSIDFFNPYLGFRVSNTIGHETYALDLPDSNVSTVYDHSIETQKNLGWIYGASFNIYDKASINLEARTGDESAYGISANVKF